MQISCKCGHSADFDEFSRSSLGIELPRGTFQCPACRYAWKIVPDGYARMTEDGYVIPPKSKLVQCEGYL